ncbi:MAG: BRO domain-containing protein [Shinella sp.]|nr:MAG: BRO domain-containing protein [Shinella sp.]
MATATALFNYNDHKIRVVDIDHQPWFVAADVCRILELPTEKGVFMHLKRLGDDEKRRLAPNLVGGKGVSISIISESGLYKLIMRSDKPEARAFQDWVTRIVLPAIRKDGGYIVGEEKVATGEMDEDTLILKAMEVMRRKIDRLAEEKEKLQAALAVR